METGLQEFGNKLGVPLTGEKNWHPILNEANKAIKAMNHKDQLTKIYAAAVAHLYNVKLAWRNEVMHPKETYTEDQAEEVFLTVKIFMSDLAQII